MRGGPDTWHGPGSRVAPRLAMQPYKSQKRPVSRPFGSQAVNCPAVGFIPVSGRFCGTCGRNSKGSREAAPWVMVVSGEIVIFVRHWSSCDSLTPGGSWFRSGCPLFLFLSGFAQA